jgi:hypothetical protein
VRDELSGSAGDVQPGLDRIEHHRCVLVLIDQNRPITVDHGCRVTSDCCARVEVVQVEEPTSEMVSQLAQERRLADGAWTLQQHDGTLLLALQSDVVDAPRNQVARVVHQPILRLNSRTAGY